METTLSVLHLMPSTKDQVNTFSSDIINRVKSGDLSALQLRANLKFIEMTLEKIKEGIKSEVMNEASKYEKSFEYRGFRITQKETGIKYDFSSDKIHALLSEKIEEREKLLKSISKPIETVDTETGETTTLYPPIKKSTTSLEFKAI